MSGKTLGQIAYEAYCRHVDRFSPPPWEHLHSGYQDGWQEVANAVAAHAAGTAAEDDGAAEITRLRADLADAEAEILRWPRCPAGCRCRVGTNDADALECGCDGPCNGGAAPAEPKPAMGETRELRKVVREFIGMFHGIPGGYGARTSVGRLNRLAREAGVEPPQPGDPLSAVVADELGVLRDRITTLAAALDSDALATAPSKKSQIQEDAARRIREAMA